jgi:hypothetical protein
MQRISQLCGITFAAVKADPGLCPWDLRITFKGGVRTANIIRDLDYPGEIITHV